MSEKFVDPIVAEIHAIRAAMLEAADGDIGLMMQQVAERQRKSKHHIVRQPFRQRTEPSNERECRSRDHFAK
jgi:hypothetical protein